MSHFTSGNMNKTRKKGWTFFWVFMLVHIVYVALGYGISLMFFQDMFNNNEFPQYYMGTLFFLCCVIVMILPAIAAAITYCKSKRSGYVYLCPLALALLNIMMFVVSLYVPPFIFSVMPGLVVLPIVSMLHEIGLNDVSFYEFACFVVLPSIIYVLEILVTTLVLRKHFFTIENQYVE